MAIRKGMKGLKIKDDARPERKKRKPSVNAEIAAVEEESRKDIWHKSRNMVSQIGKIEKSNIQHR